jgi:hypothetical protein
MPQYELLRAAYAPSTVTHYRREYRHFKLWLRRRGRRFSSDPRRADKHFLDYIHYLYRKGGRSKRFRSKAAHAVFGTVMKFPGLRGNIPCATRSLKGWERKHPATPAVPISWTVACALSTRLCASGHWDAAAVVLVAHDTYTRPSEPLLLTTNRVVCPSDDRLGASGPATWGMSLWDTKTKRYDFVKIRRKEAAAALDLARYRAIRLNRERVFGLSYRTYLDQFKVAAAAIGLPNLRPHGLRHGGATADSLGIGPLPPVSISDIAVRGRWASERSARHYVQSGLALTLEADLLRSRPPSERAWIRGCERLIVRTLRSTQYGG